MTALLPAMAGANLIYGLGMLESGITMSFGQLVADNEIAKMVKRVVQGIPINDVSLAVDVIHQVGAGGHFISEEHTYKYMRTEQAYPKFIDRNNRERWKEIGGTDMAQRVEEEARYILQNHKPDPLAERVKEEFSAIIKEAEEEMKARKNRR